MDDNLYPVKIEWQGKEYHASVFAYESGLVVLPDRTVLQSTGWDKTTTPPQAHGWEEVYHPYINHSVQEIAKELDADIAIPLVEGRVLTSEQLALHGQVILLARQIIDRVQKGKLPLKRSYIEGEILYISTGGVDYIAICPRLDRIGHKHSGHEIVWTYHTDILPKLRDSLNKWLSG